MDTLTHLALGAVLGSAIASKKIGNTKAMAVGAAAQIFPDIDIVAALWLSPAENLVAHRGITHSLVGGLLSAILFVVIAGKVFRNKSASTGFWLLFFSIQIYTHIFVDLFNAYGVALLEPFSTTRLSFHSIYVADPLFMVWILIAAIILLIKKRSNPVRIRWLVFSLGACSLYLAGSLLIKSFINKEVKTALQIQDIGYRGFITTPTPFNTMLWYVVINVQDGYYTGYRSVFDQSSTIKLTYISKNEELAESNSLPGIATQLIDVSQQYYVYSSRKDTVSINLMLFGQVAGWENPEAPFILECGLIPQETSMTLLQERRAKEMNVSAMRALVHRIFNEENP